MSAVAIATQGLIEDESMHCNFGIDLINTIKLENPHLWTQEFRRELTELFHKAVELDNAYAEDTMPRGGLDLNAAIIKEYLQFTANRRAEQIGLNQLFRCHEPVPVDERAHRSQEVEELL
jgi:ribonucleoside-diphosphate reductase beta chain